MGQILLVRHGQASWGAADYDVLSPLGERQAAALGACLAGVPVGRWCTARCDGSVRQPSSWSRRQAGP